MEQLAFLRRSRKHWGSHLNFAREFIGSALQNANPARSVLILGAGWGLEIPWRSAPIGTFGWDADPLSRFGTYMRHRRWAHWMFSDFTDAFAELDKLAHRLQIMEGRWALRPAPAAARRMAGLLPSFTPSPKALEAWIREYSPGTIICANVLGQIKPMAYRMVELAFKPRTPWVADQDIADPLQNALDEWTAKVVRSLLNVLRQSGSDIYMLHDRGVVHQDADLALGEWTDPWPEQLRASESALDISDPLPGIDILQELDSLSCKNKNRWIWPVGAEQIHIVEALEYRS
jgi:hypothetical protein